MRTSWRSFVVKRDVCMYLSQTIYTAIKAVSYSRKAVVAVVEEMVCN